MVLYIIGIGLNDEKDITVKGLEAVKSSDEIFLEGYTSKLACSIEEMEKFYGKKITVAEREFVETSENIIDLAKEKTVSLLVIGDSLSATTHVEMMVDARKAGVETHIIHNASVMTAVAITGLQLYKFGRTASIPFPEENWLPETPYDVLKENQSLGLHTLMLLDLRPIEDRFMTVGQAIENMQKIEEKRGEGLIKDDTLIIGCARLGSDNPTLISGTIKDLKDKDFMGPPHCIIIPGKMHFMEEEMFENLR